jgi:hypothetical protein
MSRASAGRHPFRPRLAARASATAGSKHGDGMTDPGTTDETRQTKTNEATKPNPSRSLQLGGRHVRTHQVPAAPAD